MAKTKSASMLSQRWFWNVVGAVVLFGAGTIAGGGLPWADDGCVDDRRASYSSTSAVRGG